MGDILLPALALLLVIEGLLPFLVPAIWRETFRRLRATVAGPDVNASRESETL